MPLRIGEEIQEVLRRGEGELKTCGLSHLRILPFRSAEIICAQTVTNGLLQRVQNGTA